MFALEKVQKVKYIWQKNAAKVGLDGRVLCEFPQAPIKFS